MDLEGRVPCSLLYFLSPAQPSTGAQVTVGPYTRGADHVREARTGDGVRAGNPERVVRDNHQG